jgi:hypothetical protein
MTHAQLRELAAEGVTQRIHAIEAELATYYKGWPHLFTRRPAPARFLKAAAANGDGRATSWTPERRANHARALRRARAQKTVRRRRRLSAAARRKLSIAMKRRHASGEMARAKAKAAKKRAAANG